MIGIDKEQTLLKFGYGDICIAGGYTDHGDKRTGFVVFSNQEPREIGIEGDIRAGEADLNDYPVVMTFDKKESIDAVIRELEKAKSFMG